MSSIVQKVKDAVHSKDKDHTTTTGTTAGSGVASGTTYNNPESSNYGSHSSNVANKMYPSIDSDRDGRATHAVGHQAPLGGAGHNTHGTAYGTTGTTGTVGSGLASGTDYNNPQSSNYGSHSSNVANKLDPTIDSDRDGRAGYGSHTGAHTGAHTGTHTGTHTGAHTGTHTTHPHGTTGTTGSGLASGTDYNNPQSSNYGSHSTNIANKLDPTIDSDRDGRAAHGTQYGNTGTTGTHSGIGGTHSGYGGDTGTHSGYGGNTGTHSGYGGNTGVGGSSMPGSGNAPNTAGTHNSDLLNKLDPRIDSDLDGSKTMGGNKTFQ